MNELTELLQSIKHDLLSRRLLPLLVLLGLLVMGAFAYAATVGGSSGSPSPLATPPGTPSAASTVPLSVAQANPNEAVAETPGGTRFQSKAHERDPFTPLPGAAKAAGASANGSKSKSAGGSKTGSSGGTPSTTGTTTGKSTSPTAPSPNPSAPVKPAPKPTHAGLTSTQSYDLALSLTSQGGNLDAIESLERLSVLPSEQQPLLVYLGVLQGGHDALFAVRGGTVVSGPGGCTPGPTDCEILSLAPGQIENLAVSTGRGDSDVALFAVTAIKAENHSTVAAANRARREASAAGRALLEATTLPAWSLFEYEPTVGAVVDLRNLAVGGEK